MSGSQLRFDPLTQADLPFLLEVRNGCRELLHDDRAFTLTECEAWFAEQHPEHHIIRLGDEPIGYFRITTRGQAPDTVMVGADLHERFRSRGLGRRTYEEFLPVVKERYRVSSVQLEVLGHNAVALRLYRALGFVEVARIPAYTERGGVPVDNIVMRMEL